MVKVALKDIRRIEAERNYCRLFPMEKEYLIVATLKEIDKNYLKNIFQESIDLILSISPNRRNRRYARSYFTKNNPYV